MQKQKTIAKWLAIVVLCSVAVGSYLLYDALYVKKSNDQATADDVVDMPSVEDEVPDTNQTPPHVPYYTTLPRPYEIIDGMGVTHFGGEGDDTLHAVHNYQGKRLAIFSSKSVEFDMRKTGLSVAVIGNGVERINHLSDEDYLDGVLTASGLLVLAKSNSGASMYLLNALGEISARINLPEMTDGELYLSGTQPILFYISKGYLCQLKILENMSLQQSPFVLETDVDALHQCFDTPNGQMVVAGANDHVKIYSFEHNKGFKLLFSQDKLSFKQIITAGTSTSCNYVMLGVSAGTPTMFSFDSTFQVVGIKGVEGATDGVIFPCGDGVSFVGNGVTETYCKHLDKISSSTNTLTFDKVVKLTPTRQGFVVAVSCESSHLIMLIDGDRTIAKPLENLGQIVGITSTTTGVSVLVNTPSNQGIFRGNFGGIDPYVLDLEFDFFIEK